MKHVQHITVPKKAADAWMWTIGGILGGLAIDTFILDPGQAILKKPTPAG